MTRRGMTRVLVVGSGAREHALAWACARGSAVEVLCAPGNGGTAAVAENLDVAAEDVPNLVRLATERAVDLVVIGPDAAVAAGLADACAARGLAVFGPTRAAGRIEASKEFAKQLMDAAGIPTARWRAGGIEDSEQLSRFAADLGGRCAVKADGLALGKGVMVCDSLEEALAALDACLIEKRFGEAGRRVVVEERLVGREVSVFALSDGEHARLLPPACDYKRARDGDRGPNTGGMGAYAPPGSLDVDALLDEVGRSAVQPCLDILRERGTPYRGCLYAGLMLTDSGPRVLEFNARFGDPEAQVVLPMLDADLVEVLQDCATGTLAPGKVRSLPGVAVGVVAAAQGYPGSARSGDRIDGLGDVASDVLVFCAGARRDQDGSLRTSGGRVLTVVGRGATAEAARQRVYDNLGYIRFAGMWYRRDIAVPARAPVAAR
jgi:phosphoribosylamine---glycine ligase